MNISSITKTGFMKRITLEDIAKDTNLSLATITRVIHENGYVSIKNKDTIRASIKKLGYVPNKVARGLRNQRTDLIGHVMGLNDNPLTSRMADAIHSVFDGAGYHVISALVRDSNKDEKSILENLAGFMVEAVIFNAIPTCGDDVFRWLISQGISIVLIERIRNVEGIDVVSPDNENGSEIAVRHFIDKGHADIAYIGVEPEWGIAEKQRYDGFYKAMSKCGRDVQKHFVVLTPYYSIENGYTAMEAMFNRGALPTAIFTTSDLLACGVLQCLYGKGLRVPDDISIIGYDNTLADACVPPFSSIDMRPEQIGQAALEMICERKSQSGMGSRYKYITPFLVDRGSVRSV